MSLHLHIVSFNVPWPADYGGVMDVYYRCKALSEQGVRLHLHCFAYGRPQAKVLEDCCEEVCYYQRDMSPLNLLTRRPFIVSSRQSEPLMERLLQDRYPVLLEGLHCCWVLEELRRRDEDRCVLVRAHNVEHDYYAQLSRVERRWAKRPYLRMEARKLERYEPVLRLADAVLAVTRSDAQHFEQMGCEQVHLVPSSLRYSEVSCAEGRGTYAFYHGDLSVSENVEAARFLMDEIFVDATWPLVLAGRNPHPELQKMAEQRPWVRLVANPDDEQMGLLLQESHATVLVTFQSTGLKLKLLNSLYHGRFCVVNEAMVFGTELGQLCEVAGSPEAIRERLRSVFSREFTSSEVERRQKLLCEQYDNNKNARILITLLKKLQKVS